MTEKSFQKSEDSVYKTDHHTVSVRYMRNKSNESNFSSELYFDGWRAIVEYEAKGDLREGNHLSVNCHETDKYFRVQQYSNSAPYFIKGLVYIVRFSK